MPCKKGKNPADFHACFYRVKSKELTGASSYDKKKMNHGTKIEEGVRKSRQDGGARDVMEERIILSSVAVRSQRRLR